MKLDDIIIKRRATRSFIDKDVEREKIEEIINAANWAPSASNKQGWRFIIISSPKLKKTLFELGMTHLLLSPTSILVLYGDPTPNPFYPDDIESASASIQNMMLKATELGLGTCWVNRLPEQKYIMKLFSIPWYYKVVALVGVGYPKVDQKPKKRKYNIDEILFENDFRDTLKVSSSSKLSSWLYWFRRKLKRMIRGNGMVFGYRGLKKPDGGWPGMKDLDWMPGDRVKWPPEESPKL